MYLKIMKRLDALIKVNSRSNKVGEKRNPEEDLIEFLLKSLFTN